MAFTPLFKPGIEKAMRAIIADYKYFNEIPDLIPEVTNVRAFKYYVMNIASGEPILERGFFLLKEAEEYVLAARYPKYFIIVKVIKKGSEESKTIKKIVDIK